MKRIELLADRISQNSQQNNFTKISIYYNNAIGYISMRSPKDLNCLSIVMMKQICDALKQFNEDELINVIVITSELTNIFCAGADIKEFGKTTYTYEFGVRYQPLHIIMEAFKKYRKPVIAAVNGKALGGGFQLALLCDIIIASEKSLFGFPEINLGLMPGLGGTQKFTRIVGQKRAMYHILTGDTLSAESAWQSHVAIKCSSQKFNEEVHTLAEKIASKALTTAIIAKKSVKQASNMTEGQGLDFEKDIFYSLLSTKAAKQGVSAFLGKRKANFKGL